MSDACNPAHRGFNRECDVSLDLFGGKSFDCGVHLHLDVGDVRNRVNRKVLKREISDDRDKCGQQEDHATMVNRKMNDLGDQTIIVNRMMNRNKLLVSR